MAKLVIDKKEKSKGDLIDGFETVFNGKKFTSTLYGGDTRNNEEKAEAHRLYLLSIVIEDAVKRGLPEPEKEK
jgi:hypothetical protein